MPGKYTKKEWYLSVRLRKAVKFVAHLTESAENPRDFWRQAYEATKLKTEDPWEFNFYDVIEAVRLVKRFYEGRIHDDCNNCPFYFPPDKMMKTPDGTCYGSRCVFDWKDDTWEIGTPKEQKEAFECLMGN